MTISTTSTGLSPGALAIATQIAALQTQATANQSPAHLASIQQKIAACRLDLVHTLMGSGRISAANIITSTGLNASLDPAVGAAITSRTTALATQSNGDHATQINALQIQAVANALKTGNVSAAQILASMS